ncbi:kinase [Actinorhabdospora filicis]|uniref:Kinase n=1 Tax=Actinorhabdospora filicis TaxID=1785913 RepID=A0A9W6W2Y9_9ACTN|nr:kinase [Actinorhabdospora filicis]GLZ77542.1 kinase [Actinorhabdospora filicis]
MTRPVVTAAPFVTATATAGGTFGELLQGALPDGRDFLVTLPITRSATALLTLDPSADGLTVFPASRTKSRTLVERALDRRGLPSGGVLRLSGDLPVGKGFASSSADLVATARALGRALGESLGPAAIAAMLRDIEPTDGVMYDGAVAFYHREVRLREVLGPLPPTTIVAVDEGGEVDTIAFNRVAKPFTRTERRRFAHLLRVAGSAIRNGDARAIGAVATESALLNQQLRPKRTLDAMIGVCAEIGGVGVAVAHSGTTVGVLVPDDDPSYMDKVREALEACRDLGDDVAVYHTNSG